VAEEDKSQERTEQATPKRLKEARERGQVPRSRELNTMVMLLAGSGGLLIMGEQLLEGVSALLRRGWVLERALVFDTRVLAQRLAALVQDALVTIAPLLALLFAAALAGPALIGGWSFSAQSLGFKWEKLDPVKGLGRIFAWRGLMELTKTLVKFVLVGAVSAVLLWQLAGPLLSLGAQPLESAMGLAARLLSWSFLGLSAVLILIALVDVPFQLWDHARQLKMTRQEVRDELKETDGRPEVKGRIRALQREMAQRRMMEEVPKADVVIVNPTHFAVALRFDRHMSAPRVVAKGADLIAARIRGIAQQHDVAVFSAPPLARALYHSTELGQEIPAALYVAVAQVLAYVYQLRSSVQGLGPEPAPPQDLPVAQGDTDLEEGTT
jgi:flagellar biosynthetic protein FlhB